MKTEIRLFQKFDPNVERGQNKACELCNSKFSVFLKQHQCKRCLRAVCSNCGTTKRDVYKPKMQKKPHRLCKLCANQSTVLIQYTTGAKLVFGQDSEIAKKWQSKLPKLTHQNIIKKQQRKFTEQIFNQLWDSYNYSLREFMGLITYTMSQTEVYSQINKTYLELQNRGIQQKLQNIIPVIIFLLCFSSYKTCADLVQYLCNLRKTVADNNKQMLITYLKSLKIQQSQSKKLNDYLAYKIKQVMGTYSINTVTAQCTIHVISRAFEKQRIDQLFMLLGIILQENWEYLVTNRGDKNLCDFVIIRNCNMSTYIDKFKQLVTVKVGQFTTRRTSIRNTSQVELEENQKLKQTQRQKQKQKQKQANNEQLQQQQTKQQYNLRMNSIRLPNSDQIQSPPPKPSFKKKQSLIQQINGFQQRNSYISPTIEFKNKSKSQMDLNRNINMKIDQQKKRQNRTKDDRDSDQQSFDQDIVEEQSRKLATDQIIMNMNKNGAVKKQSFSQNLPLKTADSEKQKQKYKQNNNNQEKPSPDQKTKKSNTINQSQPQSSTLSQNQPDVNSLEYLIKQASSLSKQVTKQKNQSQELKQPKNNHPSTSTSTLNTTPIKQKQTQQQKQQQQRKEVPIKKQQSSAQQKQQPTPTSKINRKAKQKQSQQELQQIQVSITKKQIKQSGNQNNNINNNTNTGNKILQGLILAQTISQELPNTQQKQNNKVPTQKQQKSNNPNKNKTIQPQFQLDQQQLNQQSQSHPVIHFQKQQCLSCTQKQFTLHQLSQQLQSKSQQLQKSTQTIHTLQNNLQTLKLQLKQSKQHNTNSVIKQQEQQLNRTKLEVSDVTQKYNTAMREVFKYQKQSRVYKNQIQQLKLHNKILQSKLEQSAMGINYNQAKSTQNQEQLTRMNQLMKKSIENKNRQLQALVKKNKQLTTQLDQLSRSQMSMLANNSTSQKNVQKLNKIQKQKQDLMKKLQQLSTLIVKEQQQKLGLSSELFQIRRLSQMSQSGLLSVGSTGYSLGGISSGNQDSNNNNNGVNENNAQGNNVGDDIKKRISDCSIF